VPFIIDSPLPATRVYRINTGVPINAFVSALAMVIPAALPCHTVKPD
jgi:hypothetical protein